MSDLQRRIANLSPEKQRLLIAQLAQRGVSLPNQPTIPRKQANDTSPLSFTQQRLWFIHQLEPDSPAYNMPKAFSISGPLKIEILHQALEAIVARHEALRTTFIIKNGEPTQVIAQSWSLELPVIDLSNLPVDEREEETQRLLLQETKRPFNLSQDLMIRGTLLRLDDKDHILLLVTHHITSDHWSTGILQREIAALYEAFISGTDSPLPDLPIQYADFATWQRRWLQGEELERQLTYWRDQLGQGLPTLDLPTDRPRPPVQSYQGARQSFQLPEALSEAANKLSRREGATLFMTLLAAFKILLYRYTGQDDIIVGSPIAGRNRVETESLIGSFINTLVLRTNLSENPSFLELLKRTRKVVLEAQTHQELPFEKLVEALQPERDLSHPPLFQVMFNYRNGVEPVERFSDMTMSRLEIDRGLATYDLTFFIKEKAGELSGVLEYNTGLFDAATITRMIGHFQTLLAGIFTHPDTPISQLPFLTNTEQEQLLVTWNDTTIDLPQDGCIHQYFEAQVERSPNAVAVIFKEQTLRYDELNAQANQLAHYLRKLGVEPGMLVGLCVERSLDMIVGILGILKAGGAYVPLDPTYPKERLAFMLADAGISVLVTQEYLLSEMPKHSATVVCLDTDWQAIAKESKNPPPNLTRLDDLAYVIYTSGSTGKPKGVMVSHKNLVHSTNARLSYYQDPIKSFLLLSSFAFDSSVAGIFWTLCQGGSLCLPQPGEERDPSQLIRLIAQHQISHTVLLPSLYGLILETEDIQKIASLCTIIVAGEACLRALVDRHNECLPSTTLFNEYGPTEATVWSSVYNCQFIGERNSVPIGRPIANTQIFILDSHLQPVPVGIPGELYIGGAGLTQGYLNRPELTDEKFIQNPFANKPTSRLYRTGDLARYLPDGNIEFLGRTDHQVKIRGFRIELEEIEATLRKYPAIQDVVVITREDIPGDKRLVAYVVSQLEEEFQIGELRRFLKEKLPDYMIPAAFVPLDVLPLTPNGKVNRNALPIPDLTRLEPQETFVAPQDDLELQLAKIWEQFLGVRPISIRDNFFDLGGHSVLAVRLFAQIGKVFGKDMPLATLFQAPTIEQLANILRDEGWSPSWSSLVPIQPNGSKTPLFCAHAVGGNVLSLRALGQHLGPDQPFYALQSQGLDGKQVVPKRVQEMAAYYIEEIRTIQPEGPYYLAGQSSGGTIAFEMAQQLYDQGQQVALLALIDSRVLTHSFILSKVASLRHRLSFHMGNLTRLGANYFLIRAKDRSRRVRINVEGKLVTGAKKLYLYLGRSLPPMLRYADVREMIRRAIRGYEPQIYPGRVVLFRATDSFQAHVKSYEELQQAWSNMAEGGIEILNIPGEHNLEKEPFVGVLAEHLKPYLEERVNGSNQSTKR